MPPNVHIDWDKFLSGQRDKWDVTELEVFLIPEPIQEDRYIEVLTNLINLAHKELPTEVQKILWPLDFPHDDSNIDVSVHKTDEGEEEKEL